MVMADWKKQSSRGPSWENHNAANSAIVKYGVRERERIIISNIGIKPY